MSAAHILKFVKSEALYCCLKRGRLSSTSTRSATSTWLHSDATLNQCISATLSDKQLPYTATDVCCCCWYCCSSEFISRGSRATAESMRPQQHMIAKHHLYYQMDQHPLMFIRNGRPVVMCGILRVHIIHKSRMYQQSWYSVGRREVVSRALTAVKR